MAQPKPTSQQRGATELGFQYAEMTGKNTPPTEIRKWLDGHKWHALNGTKGQQGKGAKDRVAYFQGQLQAVIALEKQLAEYEASYQPTSQPKPHTPYFIWKHENEDRF